MFTINQHPVGEDAPAYIIAELSANHNQDFDLAIRTIQAAKEAGADAIKLQTYTADTMTLDSELPHFMARPDSPWAGQKLYDLYQKAYTPWEWHPKLMQAAQEVGLDCFSSPFDATAVDFLESLDVPAYKIASMEIFDIPLIRKVAAQGKPVIFSTGIAEEKDIALALETCREEGNEQLAVLKCTSAYPTPLEEVNLRTIPLLRERFGTVVGLSDHTLGTVVPVASVALGAKIIEKHFMLDKSLGGVDSSFSLDLKEFAQLVRHVRAAEKALGTASLQPSERAAKGRKFARSLFVTQNIRKGEPFTSENLRAIRPGLGAHPKYLPEVLGKVARRDIERGTPFSLDMTEESL